MSWAHTILQPLLIASPLQKFLVVEGTDDRLLYERWLERLDPGASGKVQVESAGNKKGVLDALDWLKNSGGDPANVFGLVDRDDWTAQDIHKNQAKLPNLRVNPDRLVAAQGCLFAYQRSPVRRIARSRWRIDNDLC